jgi:hypothetical protein
VLASNNAFTSLLITEGTEPTAPAAGKQRLYVDSTTHLLKRTDTSGVERTIEAALYDINAQTGTSYTLVLADLGKLVTMTNAGASTLTVPPNSSVAFPVGASIKVAQLGAGQVTLTQGSGVTIHGDPGLKVAVQYAGVELVKYATDTWLAIGRLAA